MKKFFKFVYLSIVGAMSFVLLMSNSANADNLSDLESVSIMGQLAPACGLRDAKWAEDLLQGATMTIQAIIPQDGMFLSASTLKQWKLAQAGVGAAYVDGKYLFATYGKSACDAFIDQNDLSTADQIVKDWRSGDQKQLVDPSEPAEIPNAALQVAWTASRADLALGCGVRTDDWGDEAASAMIQPLGKATYGSTPDMSDDDKNIAFDAAMAAYKFDQALAGLEQQSLPSKACSIVKNSPELKQNDKMIATMKANPNPWAGAGGN